MYNKLSKHINKFSHHSDADLEKIQTYFNLNEFDKKEIIQSANTTVKHNYFILEGCVHMFFIDDKGIERTVQFAIENWWITDNLAFLNKTKSQFYIQAVEPTKVLSISFENKNKLLYQFPTLEKYFRIIFQISYGAILIKSKFLHQFSKEELYFHFTDHFPDFAQRVPQYLIASYLGLTPEYVSEIRNKKRS